uniref:F-box protein 16 n=1 Tax=Lates calcarifer TaxID=8187 RepID=A0A4W6C6X8_LATCA
EMPHAPRSPANCAKTQTKLSAWTPLNHPVANSKVTSIHFSWNILLNILYFFDRWSDSQRKAVLQDFVLSCSQEQLRFLSVSVSRQLPLQAADFTCLLPRALCLYLFSFLDPRSLCRCAQVSWHWKSIVELDQLWMPKCLRLGWCLNFSPTPLEQGVWKRHYIQTVQELRLTLLQPALLTEERPLSATQRAGSSLRTRLIKEKQPTAPPPWRDSDRYPKTHYALTTWTTWTPQMKSTASTCRSNTLKPDGGSKKTLSEAKYKLRKAKSLVKHAPFIITAITPL